MSASCYYCSNDPYGTCFKCHSWACSQHGQRGPNVPRFVCAVCTTNSLGASAGSLVANPYPSSVTVQLRKIDPIPTGENQEFWRFKDFDEFQEWHPGYADTIEEIARFRPLPFNKLEDQALRNDILEYLSSGGQQLLTAAVAVLKQFNITNELVARPLLPFVELWERGE